MRPVCVLLILTFILLQLPASHWTAAFDPLSAVVASLGMGLQVLNCKVRECCSDDWVILNISGLAQALQDKLYGQHLVSEMVLEAVQKHVLDPNPNKALALSFHGWTGGGKNYVARIISEHLFYQGMQSGFVHLYVGPTSFPHKAQLDVYKTQLQEWIQGNITRCARSLFIFDEVDMIPSTLLDAIKPFLETKEDSLSEEYYGKAIFLFLSSSGGNDITYITQDFWRWGRARESITMSDLVHIPAFQEEELFWRSSSSGKCLIDYQIPFLPLERQHILLCIRDDLHSKGHRINKSIMSRVADELTYYPPMTRLFSKTGCKRVHQKVNLLMSTVQ